MIHVSRNEVDLKFISKTLEAQKLAPIPVPGFENLQGWHAEQGRYKRVVERYSWGAVVFLSDRQDDDHYTLVVEGEVNVEAGAVVKDGRTHSFPVAWYPQMAAQLNGSLQKSGMPIKVPGCMGYYEGDYICDGGYNPKGQMEAPCAWRDRCMLIQGACARAGRLPEEMLRGLKPEEVVRLSAKLKQTEPIPPDPASARAPTAASHTVASKDAPAAKKRHTPKPAPKTQPAQQGDFSKASAARSIYEALLARLQLMLPGRSVVHVQSEAKPGDIFVSDRTSNSDYIAVYIIPSGGRKINIFAARLRKGCIAVQLPVPADHAMFSNLKAGVETWLDGKWVSVLRPVPDVVPFEEVCGILERLVKLLPIPKSA